MGPHLFAVLLSDGTPETRKGAVMTYGESHQCALGYAWGCEDATGKRTISPDGGTGSVQFAEMYASCRQDHQDGKHSYAPSVRAAYVQWQSSGGSAIIADRKSVLR
jgi:hypothetical protein